MLRVLPHSSPTRRSSDLLLVQVTATNSRLPAIRNLIGDGINVNITLLCSQEVYEQVVTAYLGGLEDLIARGGDPSRIASVASLFVSRIDTAVDKLIEARLRQPNETAERDALTRIRGKVQVPNAKPVFRRLQRLFAGPRRDNTRAKEAPPKHRL